MDVNDHGIELRNKAIGMLKAGLTLKKVSETLDISLRSVQRCSRWEKLGQSLSTNPGADAQKSFLAFPKSSYPRLCQRGKSTRFIARTLVNSGFSASYSTVHHYLRHSINVYPY